MAQVTISYEEYTKLLTTSELYKDLYNRYATDMEKAYIKDGSWRECDNSTPLCELLFGYWETKDDWVIFVGNRLIDGSIVNAYNGLAMPATHWQSMPYPPYPYPKHSDWNNLDL